MDKILWENMRFYGYHGVLQEEKTLGQKFLVDGELSLDLKRAGESDELKYTVDYGKVYEIIEKIFKEDRYNLLEAVAETICKNILAEFSQITSVKIRIKKPEAPICGIFDYFGVEIERERTV